MQKRKSNILINVALYKWVATGKVSDPQPFDSLEKNHLLDDKQLIDTKLIPHLQNTSFVFAPF